jgi:hypothetical protein
MSVTMFFAHSRHSFSCYAMQQLFFHLKNKYKRTIQHPCKHALHACEKRTVQTHVRFVVQQPLRSPCRCDQRQFLWNFRVSSAKFSKISPAAGKINRGAEKPSMCMPAANGLSQPPEDVTRRGRPAAVAWRPTSTQAAARHRARIMIEA